MARDQWCRVDRATWLLAATLTVVASHMSVAQATSAFVPGGRELYSLDLKSAPAGGLPKGMRLLTGKPTIVTKDGALMLKASAPVEFLVTLPEFLPNGFTLEFEIIPKACCNPEDISFEGTATTSRSTTSMHVVWQPATIIAAGGGDYVQIPMPQDLSEVLASNPTKIEATFQGTAFKLFTNGRQILDLPNKKFARGRVLRVFLGGQDDDRHAVYLSRLRVSATSGGTVASTQSADLQSTLTAGGATLTQAGTGTIPTAVGPATTAANVPTSPGVTAGPLPNGTLVSPTATLATQPATATTQSAAIAQIDPAQTPATTAVPLPADKSVTGTTTSTVAGPSSLSSRDLSTVNGWGAELKWTPIPGVTTYWVSRKPSDLSDPARYVETVIVWSTAALVTAIDPYVTENTRYTYWVTGFTRESGETKPSPITQLAVGFRKPPTPQHVQVTNVTAPQQLTMPGPLAAVSPMLGSAVTWSWDEVSNIAQYEISYEIVGGFAGVGPVFVRMTAPPKTTSLVVNVPQGKSVNLCIHSYSNPDRSGPLPPGRNCVPAQAP